MSDDSRAAVSLELSIPPLPGAMATLSDEPPLLLTPLSFVEQAQLGRNAWWRYVLAIVLFVVLSAIFGAAAYALLAAAFYAISGGVLLWRAPYTAIDFGLIYFGFAMAVSGLGLPALFLAVKWLHRRPWRTLVIGPAGFRWPAFARSLALVLALGGLVFIVDYGIDPAGARFHFDAHRFWPFLALTLLLVPFQTLAEEALFRGYILQGIARATASAAVRLAIPAFLFAVAHFHGAEVRVGGFWTASQYLVVAVYLTILALRGDGLEHAWGFHLGTNWLAFLLIGWSGSGLGIPTLFLSDQIGFPQEVLESVLICSLHFVLLGMLEAPRRVARDAAAA
jgi:membrane protease YdiL (CAAX protease family)